jgi:hypothetical protein
MLQVLSCVGYIHASSYFVEMKWVQVRAKMSPNPSSGPPFNVQRSFFTIISSHNARLFLVICRFKMLSVLFTRFMATELSEKQISPATPHPTTTTNGAWATKACHILKEPTSQVSSYKISLLQPHFIPSNNPSLHALHKSVFDLDCRGTIMLFVASLHLPHKQYSQSSITT